MAEIKVLKIVFKAWGPKNLSIAEIHPKPPQEFSELFGPFIHKIKGFSRNSRQKVYPNFAQNLGRQILARKKKAYTDLFQ